MKYYIYSESLGWYMGFYQGKHLFQKNPPTLYNDFLSYSGAESTIECMSYLSAETTPNDLEIKEV